MRRVPLLTALQSLRWHTASLFLLTVVAGCRTGRNYPGAEGPRYAGGQPGGSALEAGQPDTLRLASFNIEFSLQVDSAIGLLASDPALRGVDVLLLQEMNEEATERSYPAHCHGCDDPGGRVARTGLLHSPRHHGGPGPRGTP